MAIREKICMLCIILLLVLAVEASHPTVNSTGMPAGRGEMKQDIQDIKDLLQAAVNKLNNLSMKVESFPQGCPANWVKYGDVSYYLDLTPTRRMADARKKCQSMGGDLPIVGSAAESAYIFNLIRNQQGITFWGVWLGLVRKADNKFYWVDGKPVHGNYNAWAPGEPNDYGDGEDCGCMYSRGHSAGKWNDCFCDWDVSPAVVCQKHA